MSEEKLRALARQAALTGDDQDLMNLGLMYLRVYGYVKSEIEPLKVIHIGMQMSFALRDLESDYYYEQGHLTPLGRESLPALVDLVALPDMSVPAHGGTFNMLWDYINDYEFAFIERIENETRNISDFIQDSKKFGRVRLERGRVSDRVIDYWIYDNAYLSGILANGNMAQLADTAANHTSPADDWLEQILLDAELEGYRYLLFEII